MMRILGTIFAGLFGLAFGSFLNVCLSRWPEGESIVQPGSHCRNCSHTLSWWENIPLFSWIALGGRCRECRTWIGWRYPLVELSVGLLWALCAGKLPSEILQMHQADIHFFGPNVTLLFVGELIFARFAWMFFYWLLVALAVLDAEHLWLPDALTVPGIGIGLALTVAMENFFIHFGSAPRPIHALITGICSAAIAAGLILFIRWIYKLIRKHEGLGLGDAKLMALLAAWLGLPLTMVAFVIGVLLGSLAALVLLARPALQREGETWAMSKLPLGTFLCIGGIVSSLCGQPILTAYLRWAGF